MESKTILNTQASEKTRGKINRLRLTPSILFLACFGLILAIHIVWEIKADMPPVWDMAYHELKGWEYWQALQDGQFLPILSNISGMFLLSYCSFGIATLCMDKKVAVWAGLLTLLFPFVAWCSRLSLLDGALAGWVAAAGYCLLKSRWFEGKAWTLAFGLACAAGVLTKWTFGFYLLLPICYALTQSENRKRSLVNRWMLPFLPSLPFSFGISPT